MAYVAALPSHITVSLYVIPPLPSPPHALTNYLLSSLSPVCLHCILLECDGACTTWHKFLVIHNTYAHVYFTSLLTAEPEP